jgi:DNA polymerase-3 subunit beta
MRFIVQSPLLLRNLQTISGVLSSNSTLPILENFLFVLKDGSLVVTASDLETTMTVNIPLDNETLGESEEGIVAIPAKKLLESLKTFPDIPLVFSIDSENYSIEISAGEGKYKLSGQNADEFPQIPVLEDTTITEVNSEIIANAISKTMFATGNDELRPVMSGIFCEFTPDDFTFVATDAHKLVRYKRTDAKVENSSSFILPKKPLTQLKNSLQNKDTKVRIEYNNRNAYFSFDNIELVCRLIEGKYPNYEAVIPKENPNRLIVDRISFLNAIRRVAIFANQSTHQVRMKMNGQEIIMTAEDIDYSNEARERLACTYEGEPMEIGFNSKFLQEMLNNIDNEMITIQMSQPNRAGILVPVDNENKDEDILMLVMPVMLNQ